MKDEISFKGDIVLIKWVFSLAGIVFLILFIISMVKPILFKKRWQAGVVYGLAAILYLVLTGLMLYSEYTVATTSSSSNNSSKTSQISTNTKDSNTSGTSSTDSNDPKKKQYVDANGNGTIIGDTDSKIYHLPGGAYYEREMQKTSNNVYFKTTAEAEAVGYRASKR